MACHPVDETWLLAILSQLNESTCTNEGSTQSVEFKENFNFPNLALYARSMAAFANSSGGYLIFGVTNEPRAIVGMANSRFSQIDPARLSAEFNQVLDPAMTWRHGTLLYDGKVIGYIHTAEASRKPVVCKRSEESLREGAIYYRYPGTTQEIRYAELQSILEQIRQATENKWMALLSRIAKVGVDNTAVLDLESGEVSGAKGAMFIPPDLLPQLRFVREGEFVEKSGAPTLKLIGEAHVGPLPASTASNPEKVPPQIIQVPTHIGGSDIIKAFLDQEYVTDPKQWLLAICGEQSANYPVHYYRRQAQLSMPEMIRLFEESSVRSQGRERLIKRSQGGPKFKPGTVIGTGMPSIRRGEMLQCIRLKSLSSVDMAENLDRILEAILHLSPASDDDLGFALGILLEAFKKYPSMNPMQANRFRISVAYLDETWFGETGQAGSPPNIPNSN